MSSAPRRTSRHFPLPPPPHPSPTNTPAQIFNAADIFTGRLISEIPDALTALLTALLTLSKLHTVDLSDNAFGGRLAEPLKDFYSAAGPLRHLLLNNNGLGPTGGTIVADSIRALAALKASNPAFPPLETIVCGRNRLENGSMASWAAAYAAHKSLKTVQMVQNGIRPEGIQVLLRDGLAHCPGLQHLDLQDNTFTNSGALALATVLPGWPSLTALCIGDCLLGPRGGVLIGEALLREKNTLLTTLRLQYNEINASGVKAIYSALVTALPKLETLELNGNNFSEDDPLVDELRALFEERGFGGLDSLSDMEEDSDDEGSDDNSDEEGSVDEEPKKVESKQSKATVDNLADLLGAAKIGA